MPMKTDHSRKKGISPLVAAVLLIAFTVALGSLIFSFLSSTITQTTDTITNRTTQAIDCSAASINVEEVFVSGTTSATVRVVIKNTGFTDDLVIRDLQVFNTTGNNFTTSGLPIPDFDRGEIATVAIGANFTSCPGSFSKVIVSTTCGGISDTFTGTPKCS